MTGRPCSARCGYSCPTSTCSIPPVTTGSPTSSPRAGSWCTGQDTSPTAHRSCASRTGESTSREATSPGSMPARWRAPWTPAPMQRAMALRRWLLAHNSSVMQTADFDVLIVGAGISGIGAAYHLKTRRPGTSFAILEGRESIGGTCSLFQYPGILDDPDMVRVPLMDLSAGYVQRGIAKFPRAGTKGPWTAAHAYEEDVDRSRGGPVTDDALQFSADTPALLAPRSK